MNVRSVTPTRLGCFLVAAAVAPLLHCGSDPVHDAEVAALGNEVPGVPQGPYHRAGQPCTVCHGPEGPASTQFVLAGTVFDSAAAVNGAPGNLVGIGNVQVLVVDDNKTSPTTTPVTNCVGNFYITADQWTPAFPVNVGLSADGTMATMLTQISRATSCAECHLDPPGLMAVGHVYLGVSPNPNEERACPVSNVLGGNVGTAP